MVTPFRYIKFDTDEWAHHNRVYKLLEYTPRENSTAVTVLVEDTDTLETFTKVVAYHQIEYLEAKDW